MRRIFLFSALTLFVVFFLGERYSLAQNSEVVVLQQILQEKIQEIDKWQSQANLILSLSVLVGILGVMTGLLQKCDKKACRTATVVCGAVISIITLVNNTVFEMDHQTLRSKNRQAKVLIDQIRLLMAKEINHENPDDRHAWIEEIRTKLEKINELSNFQREKGSAALSLPGLGNAFAADGQEKGQLPEWIKKPPADSRNFYFVGLGDSRSLQSAKEFSLQDAIQGAVDFMVSQFSGPEQSRHAVDVQSLSKYLVQSARTIDTFFNYDRANGVYHYFTLIALDKKFASIDMRLFAVQQQIQLPTELSESLKDATNPSSDYHTRRLESYNDILKQSREQLPPDAYQRFMTARELRKKGSFQQASEILQNILRQHHDFYFGWYNLALTYDALKQVEAAREAFRRAIELEPAQAARDASVYNTFGHFLFRQKDYRAARPLFEKTLQLNPDHPTARKSLETIARMLEDEK